VTNSFPTNVVGGKEQKKRKKKGKEEGLQQAIECPAK
jgi:hypothetical protein